MTQPNSSPNSFTQQSERNSSRTRSPRGKSPSGRMSRWPCKDYLKGTCTNSFCKKWHPPEWSFYKTKSGCKFGEKCSYAHRQVSKRSKTNDGKSAVAMLKKNDLHESIWQPVVNRDKSHERTRWTPIIEYTTIGLSILRKSSDMQKPIQRVKFTKAIARH